MRLFISLATFVFAPAFSPCVSAHFIWLVPAADGAPTMVGFGEGADDHSAEFLPRLKGMHVHAVGADGQATPVDLTWSKESLTVPPVPGGQILLASHDLGVMDRGDSVFRLKYYAKAGPAVNAAVWRKAKTAEHCTLDLVPVYRKGRVRVRVLFQGQPVAGAQVIATGPGMEFEGATSGKGVVALPAASQGVYSIRARHIQDVGGEVAGKAYGETRHYVTVALTVPARTSPDMAAELNDIPQAVTSFGAAVLGDFVYIYGGHTGGAHSYSKAEQNNQLTKLSLKTGKWTRCVEGPHLQGLALVPSGDRLFRIGGFTAENAEGEDHRLVSQAAVAAFDEHSGSWTAMPDLPEARSSHDAAVLDGVIYVVGGWKMAPDEETVWHETAWKLDPSAEQPRWQAIAAPGFQRRALAVAAHEGKIYAVGGMDEESGPTTAVSVYDPANDTWAEGPSLKIVKPGDPEDRMSSGNMAGFGAAAFATGGSLYVTTVQGVLQKLSADGQTWEIVKTGLTPRFFHRMVPVSRQSFVVVGGSNMRVGKFEEVEVLDVSGEQ